MKDIKWRTDVSKTILGWQRQYVALLVKIMKMTLDLDVLTDQEEGDNELFENKLP